MTHQQARQIVASLTDQHEQRAELDALLRYIAGQEAAEQMDSASAGRVAHRAERRSDEAIARAITNSHDIAALRLAMFEAMDELAALITSFPGPEGSFQLSQ